MEHSKKPRNETSANEPSVVDPIDVGLSRIRDRIPPGWGSWISCDEGWYPLLVRLDTALAALAPDYLVHQVKEKYGSLRYYIELPEIRPQCCIERTATDPRPTHGFVSGPLAPADRPPAVQEALEAWLARAREHRASQEHKAAVLALETDPRVLARIGIPDRLRALVAAAEQESARTCERCSAPGQLSECDGWLKTLCTPCAGALEYVPVQ